MITRNCSNEFLKLFGINQRSQAIQSFFSQEIHPFWQAEPFILRVKSISNWPACYLEKCYKTNGFSNLLFQRLLRLVRVRSLPLACWTQWHRGPWGSHGKMSENITILSRYNWQYSPEFPARTPTLQKATTFPYTATPINSQSLWPEIRAKNAFSFNKEDNMFSLYDIGIS